MPRYSLSAELHLADDADSRAPGGAVTQALCGHWDHSGACRWPHFSKIERLGSVHHLTIEVSCSEKDFADVLSRIENALRQGELIGPDNVHSCWRLTLLNKTPRII